MMRTIKEYLRIGIAALALCLLTACAEQLKDVREVMELPAIYPDYTGVTIPATLAPLNFSYDGPAERIDVVIEGTRGGKIHLQGKTARIPAAKWQSLLQQNKGGQLNVTVVAKFDDGWRRFVPFPIYISDAPIDYGLVYRLVAPGYEVYSQMGIYERDLSSFSQKPLIENTLIASSCVNCHSFRQTDSEYVSLHVRGKQGGTVLKTNGETDILDLKTAETLGRGVYPYWHPSGRFVAYSQNDTRQVFHARDDKRVEVFDLSSDLTVYDVVNNKILTSPLLSTPGFETYPAFSPDGQSLYFCLADFQNMPAAYTDVQYNLCRIAFDAETGRFGEQVDTLVCAAAMGKSVSFPRPSYDGKYILYTLADYGNFSIWHKEADLWLLDLRTGENRPLTEVNSDDTESYHSWSSNSRWFVFSSRRDDGLYTRLYLASIDADGKVTKPFKLPQQDGRRQDPSFYSFNIPEFTAAPVELDLREIERDLLSGKRRKAE
ncbi:hypothetical protein [Parabacteroides sp. PF5-6]|uniref:TolB family protein n=1 Tax=Parabacteroides sp. PF5-6 TaxID=1742403 RepID=UPI002405EA1F|nr:hypothetical protein [Parabacteroides sp. PF5-6]MDF9831429.1 hypothetical protein [Parabacteroides sp. PF5-6]